ncbi:MAG: stage II sporulation protein M [Clostridia bacterium]|nr:stage II sporulation protein M [Clostridia bacterium]
MIWLLGCTIIASFTIYIFAIYKGILFGYIITIIFLTIGWKNGLSFALLTVVGNNLLFLPIIFLLATSGIRLYKEVVKRKINIKQELLRHTIIMLISGVFAIIVSCIDAYFLTSLLYFL